ncbi:hypothetical protein ATO8_06836 [Roseivivax marinus]|jgi:opacity protein-like surface antigen|uniref:Outer membrane protein beta-barrel domain-containing protein n=1 Tax=Roseivivax marinus TaxID=1379903 RepID=W4HNM7_9RHOB|nr:outer membrane beta-barrel protein [Roseivivax marinus]ETW13726.1 hypothetical protein ATO8_06836 [Roseivivax marinus]UMA65296.1 porin family protein [Roseivivax marinus]
MKRILIVTTALAATTTAAFAAGPTQTYSEPVVQQPVAPVESAPLYDFSGLSVGGQIGYGNIETENPELEGDGGLYGLRSYYDFDFGSTVAGLGLQYDRGDIDLDGAANAEGVLRVGPRLGYDFGRTMVYGTGGYAKAYTDDDAVGDSDGYYVGLGTETFLTENVTAGAEVLYHEFDDFDNGGLEADATTANINVNYRF